MTVNTTDLEAYAKWQGAKKAAKKAIKDAAKKKAQQQSAAVEAAIWDDREGKARPTPERRAKGDFVLRDGDDAGVTVAVDQNVTRLDSLRKRGIITQDQAQGGHDFAALIERTRLVKETRSCLNFDPVGYDGGDVENHGAERDERERAEIYLACGTITFAELRRVCCDQDAPRSLIRLRAGLTLCEKFWGGVDRSKKRG